MQSEGCYVGIKNKAAKFSHSFSLIISKPSHLSCEICALEKIDISLFIYFSTPAKHLLCLLFYLVG